MTRKAESNLSPTPENVMPYGGKGAKHTQVRQMFDSIAGHYDLMNTVMTFGLHRLWRDKALRMLPENAARILDVATGTGDVAFRLHHLYPDAKITGIDLSEGMLDMARSKAKERKTGKEVEFVCADSLDLPFGTASFDAVTVAYGVRNFERLSEGYAEMLRVLRPGGMICVIELSEPRNSLIKALYKIYSRGVIPVAGRIVSRDPRAYTYLPESISRCPAGDDMCRLMQQAGFRDARWKTLTFGVVTIYTAVKP